MTEYVFVPHGMTPLGRLTYCEDPDDNVRAFEIFHDVYVGVLLSVQLYVANVSLLFELNV